MEETVGSFGGSALFTIDNECSTAISDVRITHFMSDNRGSEFFIRETMGLKETVKNVPFQSRSGKNDNWTVSFRKGDGCFMSGKLDKSMQKDRTQYSLIIRDNELAFQYVKDGNVLDEKTKAVKSVYNILS